MVRQDDTGRYIWNEDKQEDSIRTGGFCLGRKSATRSESKQVLSAPGYGGQRWPRQWHDMERRSGERRRQEASMTIAVWIAETVGGERYELQTRSARLFKVRCGMGWDPLIG